MKGVSVRSEKGTSVPPGSAQKQRVVPPSSADLWMPGLAAVVPAADISTRHGRKDPFLDRAPVAYQGFGCTLAQVRGATASLQGGN